jgi:hypothetical protein
MILDAGAHSHTIALIKAIVAELESKDAAAEGLPLGARLSGPPEPGQKVKNVWRRRSI